MPIVQWPGWVSTTAVGPTPNFSVPSAPWVAVGSSMTGPTPQMRRPDLDGEKKVLKTMSPTPLIRLPSAPDDGLDIRGMMIRRTTFVLLLIGNGITGWTFTSVLVAS